MKKTLIAFALSALSVMSCVSQGVKISNEPNASTPLAGSEIMLVNQGGVTKIATVAQVIAGATTAAGAAQTTANNIASGLGILSKSNSVNVANLTDAGLLARSNTINVANITDAGLLARSNSVKVANIADAGNCAYSNASAFYLASNPSGYQTGSQVSSSINSAVTAATVGAVQSGGVATLGALQVTNLITPTIFLPDQAVSSPSFYFVDCTKGNYFEIKASATSPNAFSLGLTNMTDGQQITVLFKVKPGSSAISFNNLSVFSVANYGANITAQNTTSGDTWYLNWIDINNNVIFSGAKL